MSVVVELLEAVRNEIDDVELLVDKRSAESSEAYVIVKQNSKTIAYIVGRINARVECPPRRQRQLLISNPAQIPFAIEMIQESAERKAATNGRT